MVNMADQRSYNACRRCMTMLAVFLITFLKGGKCNENYNAAFGREEICNWETFKSKCTEGQVVVIEFARYGRMRSGKCVTLNLNERPCHTDVMSYVERKCAGRYNCSIQLPDRQLDDFMALTSCSKEYRSFLEISYTCETLYTAVEQDCSVNQSLVITESSGYLGNIVTDETNKGSSVCPWKFELQSQQTVHLTLLDFGMRPLDSNPEKQQICHIYAQIRDSFSPLESSGSLVCAGDERSKHLLTSTAKEVQISITKLNTQKTADQSIYFMIKFEVSGCPELVLPEGKTSVQTISSGYRVLCGDVEQDVHCVEGKWTPQLPKTCISPGVINTPKAQISAEGLQQGVLIVIVIAVAIVISAVIIVLGIFILHKKKNLCMDDENPADLDPVAFDKHAVLVYPTPTLGKRYQMLDNPDRTPSDLERDYATTLQMRQMVLPSAAIHPDYNPAAGGPHLWMCPLHGIGMPVVTTAGINTGNGTLGRRFDTFRLRADHIYELPPNLELDDRLRHHLQQQAAVDGSWLGESPFYHELDPSLLDATTREVHVRRSEPSTSDSGISLHPSSGEIPSSPTV